MNEFIEIPFSLDVPYDLQLVYGDYPKNMGILIQQSESGYSRYITDVNEIKNKVILFLNKISRKQLSEIDYELMHKICLYELKFPGSYHLTLESKSLVNVGNSNTDKLLKSIQIFRTACKNNKKTFDENSQININSIIKDA